MSRNVKFQEKTFAPDGTPAKPDPAGCRAAGERPKRNHYDAANYYYDAENRMRELSMNRPGFIGDPDVAVHQVLEYGYDALGRRVSRRELPMSREVVPGVYEADVSFGLVDRALDVVDRSYQYDGLSFHRLGEWRKREDAPIVYTRDWKENFRAEYETLMAGDRLVMRSKLDNPEARWGDVRYASSKRSYYGQDVLGSVAVLFDHHGHVDARMHYDSWGNETTGNLHDMDAVGYNGKRRDAMSGLYDYGFRDYLPEGGRWMTLDPIRDGSNWYAYVGNDPINFVDPWGLSAENDNQVTMPEGVLDQNDPSLSRIPNMAAYGCNFRSCQNVAEAETQSALTAEQIAESVEALIESGAINENMIVDNPDTVISDAFDRLGQPDTTATVGWGGNEESPDYTIIWGDTPSNSNPDGADHARFGDSDSNLINDPYMPDIQNMEHLYSNTVFIHEPEG